MAKIKRELYQTFINCTPSAAATYQVLGDDLEEMNVEMGASINTKKNILGMNSVTLDSYSKKIGVSPYKADKGTALFTFLKGIVDEEKTLDDVQTDIIHVDLFDDAAAGAYPAYKEDVFVEVVSYGGNTEGFQIPFNIHCSGKRTKGTFNPTTKAFTED